jgi:hypothetical protein
MPIFDFGSVVQKHGYTIAQIKQWRTEQQDAGLPSGFDDFLRKYGFCVHCRAAGKFITRISWRNAKGEEEYFEPDADSDPIELRSIPKGEPEPTSDWKYFHSPCEVCGGSGVSPS